MQKQLTGNESAHTTAVNNANSAHSTATANAEAARKSAEQAALTQLNSTLAQATKDKEASIAGAERTYDQTVASLDAQYGSESFNGDTGIEGARRDASISTRDAQYYASRDTSWAGTLSGSATIGNTPWTLAHPRRCGLATHLGLLADLPTIGCGKTRHIGEFGSLKNERGSTRPLCDGDEVIGKVVRTQDGVKPLFVSIGHRVSLETAVDWILKLSSKFRQPEPIRRANEVVCQMRTEHSAAAGQ